MDNITIREADGNEKRNWDRLISRFENRRVTHSSAWLRSLENSFDGKPIHLIYEKDGELAACFPGLIVDMGILRLFGSPLPGWQTVSMGPVFDPEQISTSEIVSGLAPYLEERHGVHHIEVMCCDFDPEPMDSCGFRGRPEYTFKTQLYPRDQQKNLKAMKSSARRNIRRAGELALDIRAVDDERFVDEVYDQINEVFIRGGNTVPFQKHRVKEFFVNMRTADKLLALAVYLPNSKTCIATSLFTIANKELLLWMWTHRSEYRWYRATEAMTWTAMQTAMEKGCERMDFMGRGDFKAKFGARMNGNKIRWVRSRYRWLTVARDLAEKAYRLQQSIRGKYIRRHQPSQRQHAGG